MPNKKFCFLTSILLLISLIVGVGYIRLLSVNDFRPSTRRFIEPYRITDCEQLQPFIQTAAATEYTWISFGNAGLDTDQVISCLGAPDLYSLGFFGPPYPSQSGEESKLSLWYLPERLIFSSTTFYDLSDIKKGLRIRRMIVGSPDEMAVKGRSQWFTGYRWGELPKTDASLSEYLKPWPGSWRALIKENVHYPHMWPYENNNEQLQDSN